MSTKKLTEEEQKMIAFEDRLLWNLKHGPICGTPFLKEEEEQEELLKKSSTPHSTETDSVQ